MKKKMLHQMEDISYFFTSAQFLSLLYNLNVHPSLLLDSPFISHLKCFTPIHHDDLCPVLVSSVSSGVNEQSFHNL